MIYLARRLTNFETRLVFWISVKGTTNQAWIHRIDQNNERSSMNIWIKSDSRKWGDQNLRITQSEYRGNSWGNRIKSRWRLLKTNRWKRKRWRRRLKKKKLLLPAPSTRRIRPPRNESVARRWFSGNVSYIVLKRWISSLAWMARAGGGGGGG